MKNLFFKTLFLFFISSSLFAQKEIKGKIIGVLDSLGIEKVSIINITTSEGASTDKNGDFTIPAHAKDTLLISHVAYEPVKLKVSKDLLSASSLDITLYPKSNQIEEVELKGYRLIGILEIDLKHLPKDDYKRIYVDGLPNGVERKRASKTQRVISNILNPVDALYNRFGKEPKLRKKLLKLKDQEASRKILKERLDREIILDYLDMDLQTLTQVLNKCDYSSYFIKTATDLQIVEAVLECYESNKAVR